MKKTLAFIALFSTIQAFTQVKPNCNEDFENFKLFNQYDFTPQVALTQEGREKTLSTINELFSKCPNLPEQAYLLSEKMLVNIIDPMNFGEEKNIWTSHLLNLYDNYSKNHPNVRKTNDLKKIIISYNNRYTNDGETLIALDKIYIENPKNLNAEALAIYANLLLAKNYPNATLGIDFIKKIDLINGEVIAQINELETLKTLNPENNTSATANLIQTLKLTSDNIHASIKNNKLTCDDWTKLYQTDFQENIKNISWHENALNRLESTRCNRNNPFFNTLAKNYYNLAKTAKSAYYLAEISFQNKDKVTAAKYYLESAELEKNTIEKSKIYYKLGTFFKGSDKALSKKYIENAIENNPEHFESYVILSQIYSTAVKDCTTNEFQKKALNFLASETVLEINKFTSKYKDAADRLSKAYLEKAPTKEEIKTAKMNGKSINFECWINKSIIIP